MRASSLYIAAVFSLLLGAGCSSAPQPTPIPVPSGPDWVVHAPARLVQGGQFVFVGIGEDRDGARARAKAEAFALQDLANECSLIPSAAKIESDHYDEEAGILARSYAKASVPADACEKSKRANSAKETAQIKDERLSSSLRLYQMTYDPPEGEESAQPDERAISDIGRYFVTRQQIALAKHAGDFRHLDGTLRAVKDFEKTNPKALEQVFSVQRPNAILHQASAVRETLAERERINKEYPSNQHAIAAPPVYEKQVTPPPMHGPQD